MGSVPQPRIFISYRTDDTGHPASRLFDDLAQVFGSESVFLDHQKLSGGESFGERLATEAGRVAIMLVLIGSGWLKAQNPTTGDRRLNEPDDWVRREIKTALDAGALVVPVLIDNVRPLTPADLLTVPDIQRLADKQALTLRRKDWDTDLAAIQRLLVAHGIPPVEQIVGPGAQGNDATTPPKQASARLAPPLVPRHFRGRDKEIEQVADSFRNGRWCALVAVGGSGKTAIAARIAASRQANDNESVAWLGLAGTHDTGVPQEWLANTLGFSVRAESSAQQRSARLRASTTGLSKLIVLDDPESDEQLSELLASIGSGNDVLVTTREQFPSMVRFGISIIEISPLPESDATDVLLSITGTRADTPEARHDWVALAQAVGNHPLALEVLAGDLLLEDHIEPAAYLNDRVNDGTWSEDDSTLARLRKSIADSVLRLQPGFDIAFAALGAFEGSAFSVAAVADVCGLDSADTARRFLVELRRRMYVRRQANGLFSLHPFVSETARQTPAFQAGKSSAKSTPILRHIAHYGDALQTHGGYEWNIRHYPLLVPEERELVWAIDGAARIAERATTNEAAAMRVKCAEMTSLASWYLHWRGHWDLRIRLCERVCAWAEQGLLPRAYPQIRGIVGNLHVDQGWIHLQRGDIARAERSASQGLEWLNKSGDRIFAIELIGQLALRRHEHAKAIEAFESLRAQTDEDSRIWLVFSYRLADALDESGDRSRGLAVLEDLAKRLDAPTAAAQLNDVRGRILYRLALRRRDTGATADALTLARQAVAAFAQSGIIASERRGAVMLLDDLLRPSNAEEARQLLIAAQQEAEQEGDFEMLMDTRSRLAAHEAGTIPAYPTTYLADL